MLYELIEIRLDKALALAWDSEFQKAYAELDLLLRMYPDDIRVHDLYAQVLEGEVYSFGEGYGRSDEKLRRARRHEYYVLRHCPDLKNACVYRAIDALAGQARVCGKKRYVIQLEQILHQVYGHPIWDASKYATHDSPYARGESVEEW